MALYEVTFTIYNNPEQTDYDSNAHMITTTVEAFQQFQARAMIEAQYNGRAHVWSAYPKSS